jgi:CRP-like cAMP-binding protein
MIRKEQPLIDYINRFVELSEEEENVLLSGIKTRSYLKGQYMVQQGDVCSFSAFVLKGCTKTFYLDDQGQEHVIMFSIEDWWTSDLASFITQTPSDFNVQCLENTEVVLFPHETHEKLLEDVPILERFFRKIVERALVASQKRVVRNLSMSARDRYLYFRKQYPLIEQRVPQYLIASYLGITKEFLSKIKSQLIQEQ